MNDVINDLDSDLDSNLDIDWFTKIQDINDKYSIDSISPKEHQKASPIADPKKQTRMDDQGEFISDQEADTKAPSLESLHMFAESKDRPTQSEQKVTMESPLT